MPVTVAALYRFAPLDDLPARRDRLAAHCEAAGLRGTLLLAPEGINGTIAGPREGIDAVIAQIRTLPGCADIAWKESQAAEMPFRRMKVRLKREIVTLGQPGTDPLASVGTYVAPQDWNALITAPDVTVIDTRNAYETAIGSFAGAVDPGIATFREFPAWWAAQGDRFAGRRIAMFCTGGIRCEKSTSWLKGQGVAEVFHLDGGILRYLEEVTAEQSLWQGECFVFDDRVALGPGLAPGAARACRAYGWPTEDAAPCPHCGAI